MRVRPREIDVFEDAGPRRIGGNGLWLCTPFSSNTTTSPFSMSRTYLAPMMSSAQVSDARIGQPSSSPSTSGRMPSGSRAPTSFLLVSDDERIGAFERAQGLDEAVDETVALGVRDEMQDHLGVGGRLHHRAVRAPGRGAASGRWSGCRCGRRRSRRHSSSANSGCTLRRTVSPVVE